MIIPGSGHGFPRLLIDANVLIDVDEGRTRPLQQLLRKAALQERLAMATLTIKRMEKYKGRRRWASRFINEFRARLQASFLREAEHELFAQKLLGHPELANDDVQGLVLAKWRKWVLVTHEPALQRAAQVQEVRYIGSLAELQEHLEGRLPLT